MMLLFTLFFTFFFCSCFASHVTRQTGGNTTATPVKITVDIQTRYQIIDGFGVSEAFQRARHIQGKYGLSPPNQQKVLDLLFSTESGAGLTILRNGIGSSISYDRDWMKSIEPTNPGSPNTTAKYEWDNDDAGQVWLTKEAIKRGVQTVYANAWSAPAYMKINNDDSNGGYICGVPGINCTSGDWRHAYSNYLIQYLRLYKEQEGISITHLGFLNEPDLNQTYASMQSSGFQAGDFVKILHATLQTSEFRNVQIVCCEATGWSDAEDLLAELQSIPNAENALNIYSAHGYSSHPFLPLATSKKIWQTEWADLNGRWTTAWDDLGKEGEGIAWANKIQQALTLSNTSAFLYWIGAEDTPMNSALIRLSNDTVSVSARLWALAQFARFVRPGAMRVEAKSDVGYVRVSAFENMDGGIVVGVINNGHVDVEVEVEICGGNGRRYNVTPWLTNSEYDLTVGEEIPVVGGDFGRVRFSSRVLRRSMVSFVV